MRSAPRLSTTPQPNGRGTTRDHLTDRPDTAATPSSTAGTTGTITSPRQYQHDPRTDTSGPTGTINLTQTYQDDPPDRHLADDRHHQPHRDRTNTTHRPTSRKRPTPSTTPNTTNTTHGPTAGATSAISLQAQHVVLHVAADWPSHGGDGRTSQRPNNDHGIRRRAWPQGRSTSTHADIVTEHRMAQATDRRVVSHGGRTFDERGELLGRHDAEALGQ